MFLGLVYIYKKKKKKKKNYPWLLDSHDPKWIQELLKDGVSLLLFFFLIHELLVHALISLPAHSGRIGAQAVSLWKNQGGGGAGCFGPLKVGLFNQYRTHPLCYYLYGFPLFGYPPSTG